MGSDVSLGEYLAKTDKTMACCRVENNEFKNIIGTVFASFIYLRANLDLLVRRDGVQVYQRYSSVHSQLQSKSRALIGRAPPNTVVSFRSSTNDRRKASG